MPSLNDHVGIRVADVTKATASYEQAFGATELIDPFVVSGDLDEMAMDGLEGVRMEIGISASKRGWSC